VRRVRAEISRQGVEQPRADGGQSLGVQSPQRLLEIHGEQKAHVRKVCLERRHRHERCCRASRADGGRRATSHIVEEDDGTAA
jgi:hypothetical protein